MFQISISRNTKCVDKTGFPRPGHIYVLYAIFIYNLLFLCNVFIVGFNFIVPSSAYTQPTYA